jgi:signal transduction histidine kinase
MKKTFQKKNTILSFLFTYIVLSFLTAMQTVILNKYIDLQNVPVGYIIAMVGYWAIVSAAFTLIIQKQIHSNFETPMRKLADASKKVANGDFSVYLKPVHLKGNYNYIDDMINDFNLMVEELGSIETLKTDFFSNVSHEIKTPLSVIQSYAQALQNEALTPQERKDYTNTIISYTSRLSELITNFLKLRKLENQNIQLITAPYDLCSQLADCALQFENIWETKNISFSVDIEDQALIRADASLMELVWNNLLSNAFKFTPSGGSVKLSQSSTPQEIIVSISDTGEGMSSDTMQRMFEKFYQGDSSHATEGNGLGLSLVLRVLQIVGGNITAASQLGEGSTFTVSIPHTPQTTIGENQEYHE